MEDFFSHVCHNDISEQQIRNGATESKEDKFDRDMQVLLPGHQRVTHTSRVQ